MEHLYGTLDGGGVISVAMRGDIVASSRREGGARVWRIVRDGGGDGGGGGGHGAPTSAGKTKCGRLVPVCALADARGTIVTRLSFDGSGLLWTACYDGTVRAYDVSECAKGDRPSCPSSTEEDDVDECVVMSARRPNLQSLYRRTSPVRNQNDGYEGRSRLPPRKCGWILSLH